jgi:glycosyltransferase involved in cell wall biosynthesis
MEISVVVTNYNYGRFIGRCIRSLLSQDLSKERFEIIVVDDGSSDDSLQHMSIYAQHLNIIPLEKNYGLGYSANIGMKAAKSRYIVRVDSDDYVHSSFLSSLLLGFELLGKETEAISCDYLKVTPKGEVMSYGDSVKFPIACGIAFKADALEVLGFYNRNLRINEEIDLRARFSDEGYRIRNINLPLYRYVQHEGSLSQGVLI